MFCKILTNSISQDRQTVTLTSNNKSRGKKLLREHKGPRADTDTGADADDNLSDDELHRQAGKAHTGPIRAPKQRFAPRRLDFTKPEERHSTPHVSDSSESESEQALSPIPHPKDSQARVTLMANRKAAAEARATRSKQRGKKSPSPASGPSPVTEKKRSRRCHIPAPNSSPELANIAGTVLGAQEFPTANSHTQAEADASVPIPGHPHKRAGDTLEGLGKRTRHGA